MSGTDLLLTYDQDADAAYLYLRDGLLAPVAATLPIEVEGEWLGINLDFDEDGRLVGLEVLNAERRLPATVLEQAVDMSDLTQVLQSAMEELAPDEP